MTTKPNKLIDPLIKEALKKRKEETIKAREIKHDARKAKKELDDKGWNRIIFTKPVPDGISSAKVLEESKSPAPAIIPEPEPELPPLPEPEPPKERTKEDKIKEIEGILKTLKSE